MTSYNAVLEVAKAIHTEQETIQKELHQKWGTPNFEDLSQASQETYIRYAKAAIAALGER